MLKKIPFLDGEHFWGGPTCYGTSMPIHAQSDYRMDLRRAMPNQCTTLFLSDKGRSVWSPDPFLVFVEDGCLCLEGTEFEVDEEGTCLRDAYLRAMRAHFPFEKKPLPREFFRTAQYNTWMEFDYTPTEEGVLRYAERIVSEGFEPGILMIDEGWQKHYGNWDFDGVKFPHPKEMVEKLHEMGFKVMLWVVPYVTPDGEDYVKSVIKTCNPAHFSEQFLRNKAGDVALFRWWNGVSAQLDFRKECDREFLDRQLRHLMEEYGVDGFKFDGGSYHLYHPAVAVNGEVAEDHDPAALNLAWNEFGTKYAYHEFKDTYNGGGRATIQRLCDRSHEWAPHGIDTILPSALLQGLMGYPYICPDMIGGGSWIYNYYDGFTVDEELFIRMAQASALFPMMQFSWAPWRALSKESFQTVLEAARLHGRMAEEIISLIDAAMETGEPVLRSLEYADPHQGYATVSDEFLLGEDILVCPVVTKGTFEKEIVFPEGKWQAEDGTVYEGRTAQRLKTPLDRLLWFRRVK